MSEEKSPEIAAAYREAKTRGLPDGWTCTIDVRTLCRRLDAIRRTAVIVRACYAYGRRGDGDVSKFFV
jgi:hypothetical protein